MIWTIVFLIMFCAWTFPACAQVSPELLQAASELITNSEVITETSGSGGLSLAALIGALVFSTIGLAAFVYGKKSAEFRPAIIGILLMVFPYFVSQILYQYLIGIALTVTLFVWKD